MRASERVSFLAWVFQVDIVLVDCEFHIRLDLLKEVSVLSLVQKDEVVDVALIGQLERTFH